MPTPIGHTLAGYIVYSIHKKPFPNDRFLPPILAILMANGPDLDWVPGILTGQPALYHQGISHSLIFGLLISAGIAKLLSLRGKPFLPVFSLGLFAYLSHLALDLLSFDGRAPYGIPLLWPLSQDAFQAPFHIFRGVHHVTTTTASTTDFISGVLNPNNLLTVAVEILVLLPLLLLSNLVWRGSESSWKSPLGRRVNDHEG